MFGGDVGTFEVVVLAALVVTVVVVEVVSTASKPPPLGVVSRCRVVGTGV